MGDPRRLKKRWHGPMHPWEGERIKAEAKLVRDYGLKNKREIWKALSLLREWKARAKRVISLAGSHQESEQQTLVAKMQKLGVIGSADIDAILSLTVQDILDHRLQTQVYKRGLAITQNQARQFVTHKKIAVNGSPINSPSYSVKAADTLAYSTGFSPKLVRTVGKASAQATVPDGAVAEVSNGSKE